MEKIEEKKINYCPSVVIIDLFITIHKYRSQDEESTYDKHTDERARD